MNKQVKFGTEARSLVCEGVALARKLLESTLGPGGRAVYLEESYGAPKLTKDGYSVIKDFSVENKFHNMGVELIKNVSSQMDAVVGDNTTTVGVIAGYAIEHAHRSLSQSQCNLRDLCRGVRWAKEEALKLLATRVSPVKESDMVKHVAAVAANGDEDISQKIAEIHSQIGDVLITVELSNSTETSYSVVDGLEIDKGYVAPHFITDTNKQVCELHNPMVLITDQKISAIQPLLPLLNNIVSSSSSLLIIAEDVDGEALPTLVVNKLTRGLKIAAVKAPEFGDRRKAVLEDIASLVGAQLISREYGRSIENIDMAWLGQASSVTISKEKTCIVNAKADKASVTQRCDQIRAELREATSEWDRKKLEERLSKLEHGAALIRVGGDTETAAKARKDLVQDAAHAAHWACKEGVVSGGGSTYMHISAELAKRAQDKVAEEGQAWKQGVDAIVYALRQLCKAVFYNVFVDEEQAVVTMNKVAELYESGKLNAGYDARAGKLREDMLCGVAIPDSAMGARNVINIAASAVDNFANIGAGVTDKPEESKKNADSAPNPAGFM